MSALSALGATGRAGPAAAAPSQAADKQDPGGRDFAGMLDNGAHAAPAAPPQTAQKSQDKAVSRSGGRAEPARPDSQPGKARGGHGHGAPADTRPAAETGQTPAAGTAEAKTAEHQDSAADTWPPAGLAGIGMAVPPVPNPAMPAAMPAPSVAAGLAANSDGAAGLGVAGLPAGPGRPSGPALAPVAAAALHAQAASASRPSAGGAEAAAPLAAMAALAGAADSKTGDTDANPGPDPINLLAVAAPPPPSRLPGGSAPFDGAPTPTPHLHGEQFDDALGARMSWLAEQKIGHAHIRISPAELGPVEVRLHLSGDQVNASFLSAQAEVRHALESSLPRLRELLGQHGFQLGQADVGQQQGQATQGQAFAGADTGSADPDQALQGAAGMPAAVVHRRGLLDAYA